MTQKRGANLTKIVQLRVSEEALEAIDQARIKGLFRRDRSEFLRDAVAYYLGRGCPSAYPGAAAAAQSQPASQ